MTKSLFRDTLRTIKKNLSRYVSILLIVALGMSFFVGIKAVSPDMTETAARYYADYNLMDLRIRSSVGLTDDDVAALKTVDGVSYVSGEKFVDALVRVNGEIESDIDGTRISARVYAISPDDIKNFTNNINDGSYMNRPQLIEGDYPRNPYECLVDDSALSTPDSYKIGNVITLEDEFSGKPSGLKINEFTVVGIIRSPYYVSFERGNTDIGSGKVGTYIIVPEDVFDRDYYSEVYITVDGADNYEPYSDEYFAYVNSVIPSISSVAVSRIDARVAQLGPELADTIAEGETAISTASGEVANALREVDEKISLLEELVETGPARFAEEKEKFETKFADAEAFISGETERYRNAVNDYTAKKQAVNEATKAYNEASSLVTKARTAYDNLNSQYTTASTAVETLSTLISTTQTMIVAGEQIVNEITDASGSAMGNEQIAAIIQSMQMLYPDLYAAVSSMTANGLAQEVAATLSPYIQQQKQNLASYQESLEQKKQSLEAVRAQLDTAYASLENATGQLAQARTVLDAATDALSAAETELASNGVDIQSGSLQLQVEKMTAQNELDEFERQVTEAPANLVLAKEKREEIIAQLDEETKAAESRLTEARTMYAKLGEASWTIYDRSSTPGYSGLGQTIDNIEILSNIFPIFFFLISSLICLTTMTRLVEEDRTLLGTYKALGYPTGGIVAKYVIYSLSACVFGSVLGVAVGLAVFPYAITKAYAIVYSLPDLVYIFPVRIILTGFAISVACTTLVTVSAVFMSLKLRPAVLMRPKAPKTGKRILLEKITPLWQKFGFTTKVTLRNIFRNKQRFFMTLLGIAGCTAMLTASLGMYGSIGDITDKQYVNNPISNYDFQVVFSSPQSADGSSYEFGKVLSDSRTRSSLLTAMKSVTGFSRSSDKNLDVYLLVPSKPAELNEYISLHDSSGRYFVLDDYGAVITEKLANDTGTEVGDEIGFRDSEGHEYFVHVSGIAENYTFHYIYMTPTVYCAVTGIQPSYNYALGKLKQHVLDLDEESLSRVRGQMTTDLMKNDGISAVSFTVETTSTIRNITDALSIVIIVFFVSALVLALVVLYNLTNINVIERTRELATLKVLGFYDTEVTRYIYRENIIISLLGILLGLFLGKGLHKLLVSFTAIDSVMYGTEVSPLAYLIGVGITLAIIAVVNVLLHKKLKKIDPVLSLKSVE